MLFLSISAKKLTKSGKLPKVKSVRTSLKHVKMTPKWSLLVISTDIFVHFQFVEKDYCYNLLIAFPAQKYTRTTYMYKDPKLSMINMIFYLGILSPLKSMANKISSNPPSAKNSASATVDTQMDCLVPLVKISPASLDGQK